jgi:glycosyltransferase involved in cell wall biosynthesis
LLFDALATRYLTNSDIVVSWAGSARRTIRKAKEYGARTVLECGAVHAGYLNDILREEYERLGIRLTDDRSAVSYPGSVEYELAEYDTADYLALPSEFARQSFLKKGVAEAKLLKAPYGTDSETFRPVVKQDGTFRVLYVGAVSLLKGIPVLLEAWREFTRTGAMELMLVGRVTPAMRKILARSGGGVRIAGRVEHRQLYRVYSSGSVFVLPSLVDGWALVVGEAMACGLPVICTANSGACELVRDGVEGFVVPARDAEAIAEKLDYLRRNEDRRRSMAAAARARAVEYSWDRYGELVWKNYSAIVL